jgi:hypothetical protein
MSTLTLTTPIHVFMNSLNLNENFTNFRNSISDDVCNFKLLIGGDSALVKKICFSFFDVEGKKLGNFTIDNEIYRFDSIASYDLDNSNFAAYIARVQKKLHNDHIFQDLFTKEFYETCYIYDWTIESIQFSYDNCGSHCTSSKLLIKATIKPDTK